MLDGPLPELVELAQWIRAAEDLDEALLTLARALDRAGFALVNCALVMIEPDGTFRIAGIWSAVPSRFEQGWIINALSTEDMRREADRVLAGYPVRVLLREQDLGLFGDLARKEAIEAFLVAPVGIPEGIVGLVVLSGADAQAFERIDLIRFQQLARSIGPSLIVKAPPTAESA